MSPQRSFGTSKLGGSGREYTETLSMMAALLDQLACPRGAPAAHADDATDRAVDLAHLPAVVGHLAENLVRHNLDVARIAPDQHVDQHLNMRHGDLLGGQLVGGLGTNVR